MRRPSVWPSHVAGPNGFGRNACNVICNASGHIASTPRLAERCGRLSAGFSLPARARKTRFWRSVSSKLTGRPFFWRHYIGPFTFFSTRQRSHHVELSQRSLALLIRRRFAISWSRSRRNASFASDILLFSWRGGQVTVARSKLCYPTTT
jgi:hypothetical protein